MRVEALIGEYISALNAQLRTNVAGEHAYRPALQALLERLLPGMVVTNEPARVECGAPDFLIAERGTGQPVAYAECKDLDDSDLDGIGKNREQFARYRDSLGCVIFTDYLDFRLYAGGEFRMRARVGVRAGGRVRIVSEGIPAFVELVGLVADAPRETIATPGRLAAVMAGKARLLASAILRALRKDEDGRAGDEYNKHYLYSVYMVSRQELVHDLTIEAFADLYAQTITYGLFAARLHDDKPEDFSWKRAGELIPKANPFLRRAFQDISGQDLDSRIAWIVNDLVGSFALADVEAIMKDYSVQRDDVDPLMHFYEDFLAAYDPQLRKARGVWYTPPAVVGFIVRAVDELLESRFGFSQGLADSSVTTRTVRNQYTGETKDVKMHRVQILDPAAGTGTFLAAAARQIHRRFEGLAAELWRDYAAQHLLPRLVGFELLMASYAVAHIKLDVLLAATGIRLPELPRVKIFLTNSLEPYSLSQQATIPWLSEEGREANKAKLEHPVMVMLGNPPYNGASTNKGKWILDLLADYKKEPGGQVPLDEQNPKWLNDDYVKFIRLGQYYVERTGEGILAFVTPHGFLDNPTFRGMRWQLLQAFDVIYALDLHGNARRKETAPDGGKDENVFDIMQGVSINIFVKDGSRKGELAAVYHHDLWGERAAKYDFLDRETPASVKWQRLEMQPPHYFFVPKDFSLHKEYQTDCFGVTELFGVNSVGVVTTKDSFLVCDSEEEVRRRVGDLIRLSESEFRQKYKLKDTRDWKWANARADVGEDVQGEKIIRYAYRHFSNMYIYYTGKTAGIADWPRFRVMRHMLKDNVGLVFMRKQQDSVEAFSSAFIANTIIDLHYIGDQGYIAPLYLYSEGYSRREPNMDVKMLAKIGERAGVGVTPEAAFDYVYGALHDARYRARYAEFLKVDFPRVPYPRGAADFEAMRAKGERLRRLHLLEGAEQWELENAFRGEGGMVVERPAWREGRVYVNGTQYFEGVRREVWELYIGGYQPAQKWLKDRRGSKLGYDEVQHYRRVLHALGATEKGVKGEE